MNLFELIMIGLIIILVTFIIFSNYFESEELKCLRLYKDIMELSKTPEISLSEHDVLKRQKEQLAQYVENNCPDFKDLGLMYDNFNNIPDETFLNP